MMRVSSGTPNLSIFVMWVGMVIEVRLLQYEYLQVVLYQLLVC